MKFLSWSLLFCGCAGAAQLKEVKSVYVFAMPAGLDQHLASRLVNDHVFQVVSDPKLADAVMTDQVGKAFLYKLDHINPPPPPPAQPGVSTPDAADAPHESSFTHGRGTVFLVDAKSKQVLWSLYEKPKNNSPQDLHKLAKKVVSQLEVALGEKPGVQPAMQATMQPVVVVTPAPTPVAVAPAPAPAPAKPAPPK